MVLQNIVQWDRGGGSALWVKHFLCSHEGLCSDTQAHYKSQTSMCNPGPGEVAVPSLVFAGQPV